MVIITYYPPRPSICARCREPVGRVIYEYPFHLGDERDGAITGIFVLCGDHGLQLEMDNAIGFRWLLEGMEPAWKIIRPVGAKS